MRTLHDGFEWVNIVLARLVQGAYETIMDSQVRDLPEWARSEPYDIEAKVDADTARACQKMTKMER